MKWIVAAVVVSVAIAPGDWSARLDEVRATYSVEAITQFIAQLTECFDSSKSGEVHKILAEAHLVRAELLRYEFEQLPEGEADERAVLGNRLDEAARAGLSLCETLPESSEKYRLQADFRGTLIRTRYRAKKHRKKMEADVNYALELDPRNAYAYVTKAKIFLFADDRHGGDVEEALSLLGHALDLDGSIEAAKLLRAHGLELIEQTDDALNAYQEILEENPNCRPATDAIQKLKR